MPLYEITCPNCEEIFELQVGLDVDATVKLIRSKIDEVDRRRGYHIFRTYKEILAICGDKAKSLGASEFNECVRHAIERGYLEKRKIARSWKFRWKKRHEYPASVSRKRKRRTGTRW